MRQNSLATRRLFVTEHKSLADKIMAVCACLGLAVLIGWNLYEYAYDRGKRAQVGNCAPIVVYKRMTYSDEELRRMLNYRKRAV